MRIAAVVVTYNRLDTLRRCLAALAVQQPAAPDILVVDNHSSDGTAAFLAEQAAAGRLRYRDTGANIGGAGGFNIGIGWAVEAGYTHLWVMDDDCIPQPDALAALVAAHRQLAGNYGFLSGIAYWRDGSRCRMNVQKRTLTARLERLEQPLEPVIMATFVSAFIPAERVRAVGLPYKEFFIWADDLEYTRRLSRRYPAYAVTGCRVLHDMAHNRRVDIATDTPERLPRYRYLYRNEVFLYRREGLRGRLYMAARLLCHCLRVAVSAAPDKRRRIGVILRSARQGRHFHPVAEFPASAREE